VAIAVLGGCRSRPHAPALRDDPVYQNADEGFRFLVPEGWTQHANAVLPRGKLDQEQLLVSYKRVASGDLASLEVLAADMPADTDLTAHLSGPSYSRQGWQPTAKPEQVEVDSVPGTRWVFTSQGTRKTVKEVAAFRRGERVYFFTALYSQGDAKAQEQVRRAVGSIIWKNH
jgi:predicted Zn-dependent protease